MVNDERRLKFLKRQYEEDALYRAEIDRLDPGRVGLRLLCPNCRSQSWIKLPEKRYFYGPLALSCPRACGTFGPPEIFSPTPLAKADLTPTGRTVRKMKSIFSYGGNCVEGAGSSLLPGAGASAAGESG